MATLTAVYRGDLGRIEVTLSDPTPNVQYNLQRSVDGGTTWSDVRGGSGMGTLGVTLISDYEYTPNVENLYRVQEPVFYDSFNRAYPEGAVLELTGEAGTFVSTPDTADLDITDDLGLQADLTLDSWFGEQRGIVGKWVVSGDERSYLLTLESDGRLKFWWTADGTSGTQETAVSTVPVPVSTGRHAVRVTRNGGTGAITFYTAPYMVLTTWTQLGLTQSTSAGLMYSGSAGVEIGSWSNGNSGNLDGQVHEVAVMDGLSAFDWEARPDFNDETPGTTNFVDAFGIPWTLNGDAEISAFAPIFGFNWGTADTGQDWFIGGSSSGFTAYVDNGVGVMQSTEPTGFVAEQSTTEGIPGLENGELLWSAIYPDTRASLDANVGWALSLRVSDFFSNGYELEITFMTEADDYAVQMRIGKYVGFAYTELAVATVGTWTPNIAWHSRFRVNDNTITARSWEEGDDEPANWTLFVTDTSLTTGSDIGMYGFKEGGASYRQWFGPMEANTIPPTIGATASATPVQTEAYLKSITYPMLNRNIECVDWDAMTRDSRAGFFDVKGRHEILAIADVGSSASFTLTFTTRSPDEARGVRALLTYGGILFLQPPGDVEEDCPTAYSGLPDGYVMWDGSVEAHSIRGTATELWTVGFTRVAATDLSGIIPTTITWQMLWDMIGEDGTWETVWATWPTWQEVWNTHGSATSFGGN